MKERVLANEPHQRVGMVETDAEAREEDGSGAIVVELARKVGQIVCAGVGDGGRSPLQLWMRPLDDAQRSLL